MTGERHGRGTGTVCYVWIGLNTATNFRPLAAIKPYPWVWHVNITWVQRSLINNAHLHTFQCAAHISSLDCNAIWNSDRNPAHTSGTSSILTQTSHVSRCHQHTKTHRNATTVGQAAFLLGHTSKKSKRQGIYNTKLISISINIDKSVRYITEKINSIMTCILRIDIASFFFHSTKLFVFIRK